jgi:alpha-amylase
VLGYQRRLGHERTLVLVNYGREARRMRVPGVGAASRWQELYPTRGTAQRGPLLTLPPQSVRVVDLRSAEVSR